MITQQASVKFDRNSSTVKGWDSIWNILEMEEKEKDQLKAGVQAGVKSFESKRDDDSTTAGSMSEEDADKFQDGMLDHRMVNLHGYIC